MTNALKSVAVEIAAGAIALFARAITAARPLWPESGPPTAQSIFFANHASHGDFILLWTVLPPRLKPKVRPVAGADYWLRGPLTRFVGCDVFRAVLIERDPSRRTRDPVEEMAAALDDGSSLILFPEGTRNLTEAPLLPLKSGLYHLAAARSDIDLVPVWIANLNRVLPKGEFVPVPLLCTVNFGAPMRLLPGEDKTVFLDRASAALLALAPDRNGERA